jgi:hypothetical protein
VRLKFALAGLLLSLLVISMIMSYALASLSVSQTTQVERIAFYARAYIFDPEQNDRYWNVTQFYANGIEAHQDFQSQTIRQEVLTSYDIIILSISDERLSGSDKSLLVKFKEGGGVVIPASEDAYRKIPFLRQEYVSGRLKAKEQIVLTRAEAGKLVIFYPDTLSLDDATQSAIILGDAYEFYHDLIGEYGFKGNRIYIVFNPLLKDYGADSNPIRMDGDYVKGKRFVRMDLGLLPPHPDFFHELVHSCFARTKANGWISLNGAFGEAFANLFTYYFGHEILQYSPALTHEYELYAQGRWRDALQEYEASQMNPYSLDWGPHRSAQQYLEGMLSNIADKHGWTTWNWLFKIARASQIPPIPREKQETFENLNQKDASLAFSRFIYLLSLAAGQDLRPQFRSWRFKIEPEIESLKVYRVSSLALNLSSNSVKTGDPLHVSARLTKAEGNPISNETVGFYLKSAGGSPRSIGNTTTDRSGEAAITFKVEVDAGSYEIVALYQGSLTYGQRKANASLTVEAPMTKSTTTVSAVTSTTEVSKEINTFPVQVTRLQTDWPYLVLALMVAAIAVIFVTRRLRSRPQ